jgi:hypothetical protein
METLVSRDPEWARGRKSTLLLWLSFGFLLLRRACGRASGVGARLGISDGIALFNAV